MSDFMTRVSVKVDETGKAIIQSETSTLCREGEACTGIIEIWLKEQLTNISKIYISSKQKNSNGKRSNGFSIRNTDSTN